VSDHRECPNCGGCEWQANAPGYEGRGFFCVDCHWPEPWDDDEDEPQDVCDGTCDTCDCAWWGGGDADDEEDT
jgi:hypothetical protein